MALVVGEITYTNILPLYYYLDREKLSRLGCTFVPQIPSQLNEGMAKGIVDLGGFSSFAYGEQLDSYRLLPDLSVSSYGSVGSIFLFSKVPIHMLDGKKIALTSSSATSVNLLKIILKKFYNLSVTYEVMKPNFQHMMDEHDACLLIGDDAIVTLWQEGTNLYRYDLGDLWYRNTGYPMTYAVLGVRKEVFNKNEALLEVLYDQFISSKKQSLADQFRPMITAIQANFGGTTLFWDKYFSGLCYDFSEKHQRGLIYYYQLAYELGLLSKQVTSISLWNKNFQYKN